MACFKPIAGAGHGDGVCVMREGAFMSVVDGCDVDDCDVDTSEIEDLVAACNFKGPVSPKAVRKCSLGCFKDGKWVAHALNFGDIYEKQTQAHRAFVVRAEVLGWVVYKGRVCGWKSDDIASVLKQVKNMSDAEIAGVAVKVNLRAVGDA